MPTVKSPVVESKANDWSYGGWVGTWSAKTGNGVIKKITNPTRNIVFNFLTKLI